MAKVRASQTYNTIAPPHPMMLRLQFVLLIGTLLCQAVVCAQGDGVLHDARYTAPDYSHCHATPGWVVTFEDEFNGDTLNGSNWLAQDNMTHGDTEQQLYLADEVTVSGGALWLSTRKREAWHQGRQYNFTSGWVESSGRRFQKYGRFEVRARLPSPAAGREGMWPTAWPAHWLMPEPSRSAPPNICWPVGGEVDIMEGYRPRGSDNRQLYDSVLMTYHWARECGKDLFDGHNELWPALNATADMVNWTHWHTFGVEWREGVLEWYIDGALKRHVRKAGSPSSLFTPPGPMYMILNTALTPWASATEDSGLPLEHIIDRVTWCQPSA